MIKKIIVILLILFFLYPGSITAKDNADDRMYIPMVIVPPVRRGGVRWFNCPYGQKAHVVWFVNSAGRMIANWVFVSDSGVATSIARFYVATGRGQIYANVDPEFQYKVFYLEWAFEGSGAFVEYSFCGTS